MQTPVAHRFCFVCFVLRMHLYKDDYGIPSVVMRLDEQMRDCAEGIAGPDALDLVISDATTAGRRASSSLGNLRCAQYENQMQPQRPPEAALVACLRRAQ